jgi:hypothetical protein
MKLVEGLRWVEDPNTLSSLRSTTTTPNSLTSFGVSSFGHCRGRVSFSLTLPLVCLFSSVSSDVSLRCLRTFPFHFFFLSSSSFSFSTAPGHHSNNRLFLPPHTGDHGREGAVLSSAPFTTLPKPFYAVLQYIQTSSKWLLPSTTR